MSKPREATVTLQQLLEELERERKESAQKSILLQHLTQVNRKLMASLGKKSRQTRAH